MARVGRRMLLGAVIVGGLLAGFAGGAAGPESVAVPPDLRTTFVEYGVVDAVAAGQVRTYYVAPEVLSAAVPGRALPDGTVLVMEVRDAQRDAVRRPVRDGAGRFVPSTHVVGLWAQAKAAGVWEYARFNADGTRVADAQPDRCVACHTTRAAQDFTYIFWKYVAAIKQP
jgi:Cytochrome P460